MGIWIIVGTFVNFLIFCFYTRSVGAPFLKKLIILNAIILNIFALFSLLEIGLINEVIYLYLFNWINVGIIKINFVLLLDTLTIVMVIIVLFISSIVHIYSFSYMGNDPHFPRFIAYLSLFTFFMLVLVTSGNFLQLLIGWEGVGLSSYLLICFWYTRIAANLAAIKAMAVNRIGDIFLLFTIFLIFSFFGTLDFGVIFNNVIYVLDFYFDLFFFEIRFIDLLCFFILLSACGKSAQLLLHIWLPDAMEGPTPVSALIHAATMVTAGVFLVIRCSILFEHSSKILFFMVFLGSLTCFVMSVLGAFQQDIKKIVAYSTASQLGYMFMGCGLSSYNTSFFHLFNHAFFKALLFLSMGVIIHALSDEQDLRKMGNLLNFLPFTVVIVFFGNFALLGLPFLAGFYSKDILIEVAFARIYFDGSFAYFLGLFAAFFTAFYSTRLFFRVFFSYSNFNRFTIFKIHEVDGFMFTSLILLLFCSFFVGYIFFDMFLGLGSFFFFDSIFINFLNYSGIYIEFESLVNILLNNTYYNFNLTTENVLQDQKIYYNFNIMIENLLQKWNVLQDHNLNQNILQDQNNSFKYIEVENIKHSEELFTNFGVIDYEGTLCSGVKVSITDSYRALNTTVVKLDTPFWLEYSKIYPNSDLYLDEISNLNVGLIGDNGYFFKYKELSKNKNFDWIYYVLLENDHPILLSNNESITIVKNLNKQIIFDESGVFSCIDLSSNFVVEVENYNDNYYYDKAREDIMMSIYFPGSVKLSTAEIYFKYCTMPKPNISYGIINNNGVFCWGTEVIIGNSSLISNKTIVKLDTDFWMKFLDTYKGSDLFYSEYSKLNRGLIDEEGNFIKYKELSKNININWNIYALLENDHPVLLNNNELLNGDKTSTILFFSPLVTATCFDAVNTEIEDKIFIKIFIKILPLVVTLLGFLFYYFLDDRYFLIYRNDFFRFSFFKFYNGLNFDKLFIDVFLSKFYLLSYYSFYKNIESSFFQKYNIFIFEKNVYSWFFFFKIFSKGYFFIYILVVLCFIFFYLLFYIFFSFVSLYFFIAIILLFLLSFILKWKVLITKK